VIKRILLLQIFGLLLTVHKLRAQVQNTGMTDRPDSAEMGKLTISGYVDVYYGFDFNQPQSHERAYAVSSSRHNELNINLAFMDIRYQGDRVRGRFIPGIGTYINSNYANEQGTLKNLVEAYAGIKLTKNKNIWLDAGVLGSPFTYESAISKDHLMYSRSLAAEYAPYYLTGLRLSVPINHKITAYIYVLNGWQQINDANNEPSLGTQVEYKINNNWLVNWNNYIGSERSVEQPLNRMRYFTDFYVIYCPAKKFGFTSGAYIGLQQRKNLNNNSQKNNVWGQANFTARYQLTKQTMLSARAEYMEDMNEVVFVPINTTNGFKTYGGSLCITHKVSGHAMLRLEGRNFVSPKKVFVNSEQQPTRRSEMVVANMTVWF
jgi:hypothetical protein